jgi:hypothetical protein
LGAHAGGIEEPHCVLKQIAAGDTVTVDAQTIPQGG